jgi:gluconolactonase
MFRIYTFVKIYVLILAAILTAIAVMGQESRQLSVAKPQAIADLRSAEGASLVNAKWFVQEAHIREKKFHLPGPAKGGDALLLYPTGAVTRTYSLHPQIGEKDFEAAFKSISPLSLESREGKGLFSFAWYKVELTLPTVIGKLNVTGTTAVFEIVMDDYSEIWVNGKQGLILGQNGNGAIPGFNNRNRVLLTQNARPGEKFIIYILGINGPLGKLPENYIWIRNAVVDFYEKGLPLPASWNGVGKIHLIDSSLSTIIDEKTTVRKLAEGFSFTEGPVWHPEGFLLFSDPNTNNIYRYDPNNHNISVYISHSGYTGPDIGEYGQPGSNGLVIDKEGRLIVAQHGNRRIVRHEKKGPVSILAATYNGKKFNSPNDLVLKSDGSIYFTDPPYGLPGFYTDRRKELDHQGVYLLKEGKITLLSSDLGGPNGIAFSPDEKYIYISNWDIRNIHHTKTLWRYEVQADGTLKNGKVFFDWNLTEDEEALDGIKVDRQGNLFVSAPGGLWILNSEGKLLGKIVTPERPANMAWGDDGKTLYMTAHTSIYAVRVRTGGKFSWE